MTATIIDGKETAKEKREQLAKEVEELKQKESHLVLPLF